MPVQKFALRDANVLTNCAWADFCENPRCSRYDCSLLHDKVLQRKLREIALRLAQRGYGAPKKRERAEADVTT